MAEEAVTAAAGNDQRAARAAVETGQDIPPAEYPGAVGAHHQAERAAQAAADICRSTQNDYIGALHDHRAEFAATAHGEHVALYQRSAPMLEAVEQALIRLRDLQALERELATMLPAESKVQQFGLRTVRPGRDVLAGTRRDLLDGLREALDAERPAGNRFVAGPRASA